MSFFNKLAYFMMRFIVTWKDEGFVTAIKKTGNKIINALRFRLNQRDLFNVSESHFHEIYDAYISTGQNKPAPEFVPLPAYDLSTENLTVKAIAFYLPQYHPIPENDAWWGKGFTEWQNVSKAVPNFVGHYQPHLPGELGFYDLRVSEIQQRQVELARQFGLYGFCFYYYWFNGKKLLDLPLEQFIHNPAIDFPFCLCWANENWTRTWDGLDQEVLVAQDHSPESDIAFIRDIQPYLSHQNYIKINGKPLLIVYRPEILPDPEVTVKHWREFCSSAGIGEIYLIAIQSGRVLDPRKLGFDAAAEFPPHGIPFIPQINKNLKITNRDFTGMIFDYRKICEQMMHKKPPEYPLFKTVITSWDNTARRQDSAMIFHNSSPGAYQSWLSADVRYTLENNPADQRFVFINAWNEWAEGTHLEPDRKFGYAYLDATARALRGEDRMSYDLGSIRLARVTRKNNTAVIYHLYYPELWDETSRYLDNLGDGFDLFVSIPQNVNFNPKLILQKYPQAVIYRCPNRGRDMAPFLRLFSVIEPLGYSYVCKIHTKKSLHRNDGSDWRGEILEELLGSPQKIKVIQQHLAEGKIGLVGPQGHIISTRYFIGGNQALLDDLSARLSLGYAGEYFNFIAGSMYWLKPSALSPLLSLNLSEEDFPEESGQIDGTLSHALERVLCLCAEKHGFQVVQTGTFTGEANDTFNYAVPFLR